MNIHQPQDAEAIKSSLRLATGAGAEGSWRRRLALPLIFAACVGLAYYYFAQRSSSTEPRYKTQEASVANLVATVTATGTVQPLTQVDIGSELSGTVKDVLIDDNAQVHKGDVLVTLDTTRLTAQRDRAAAQLAAAQSRLAQAIVTAKQSELERQRQTSLRVSGLTSDQAHETAVASDERAIASVAAAKSDVESAKADLGLVETDLAKSKIISPIDGMVLKANVKVGQTVAASLQAPILVTLAEDLTKVHVETAVDEADVGQVKVNQAATFKVDAFRERDFKGKIESISYYPDKTDGVVTYKTVIAVSNDDLSLRPGMTTTAKITVAKADDALAIPNEALRFVPPPKKTSSGFSITQLFMPRFPRSEKTAKPQVAEDGTRTVYVLRGSDAIAVKVKAGLSDGKRTAIVSGELMAGDQVITGTQGNGG